MMASKVVVRVAAQRQQSLLLKRSFTKSVTVLTKEPTLHSATGKWDILKAQRPIDADDQHVRDDMLEKFQIP
jgi:hypothetical protein